MGGNSWRDPNKIVNRLHSLAQCAWKYSRKRLHFILVVLYVKCFAGGVCGCLLSRAGLEHWCCRSPWSAQDLFLSISIASVLAKTPLYLPPPFPSPGSEVAQLSIYPWEQLDITALAWKKLWVDALKPVNANESSETTLWLLASGEGPSIWRRPSHLEKALLPVFEVLGSCPACCFYKGIMEGDLQRLFSLLNRDHWQRSFLLPIKSVTTLLIFHGL